ncbi:MAG: hypothetical protein KDB14_13895 [Planctomycetales bacterium]|nr:hypothetical protein [Planctomycetales bacterium]
MLGFVALGFVALGFVALGFVTLGFVALGFVALGFVSLQIRLEVRTIAIAIVGEIDSIREHQVVAATLLDAIDFLLAAVIKCYCGQQGAAFRRLELNVSLHLLARPGAEQAFPQSTTEILQELVVRIFDIMSRRRVIDVEDRCDRANVVVKALLSRDGLVSLDDAEAISLLLLLLRIDVVPSPNLAFHARHDDPVPMTL